MFNVKFFFHLNSEDLLLVGSPLVGDSRAEFVKN